METMGADDIGECAAAYGVQKVDQTSKETSTISGINSAVLLPFL